MGRYLSSFVSLLSSPLLFNHFKAIYKHAILNPQNDLLSELLDMGMPVICEEGVTPMDIITGALRASTRDENDQYYDPDQLAKV